MTVSLGPAVSIVVRKEALRHRGIVLEDVVGVVGPSGSDDRDLVVLGPFFEEDHKRQALEKLGLVWYDDFSSIHHSGGEVPDWREVHLALREGT